MHCPRCNALNPDDAKFCSLCLDPLGDRPKVSREDQPHPASGGHQRELAPTPTDGPHAQKAWELARDLGPQAGSDLVSGPVRKTDKGVSWFCPSCDTENPLESNRCKVCGSTIFDAFQPAQSRTVASNKSASVAGLISAVPGAGHLYLGHVSEGITRLLLGAWWFGTSALLPAITPVLLTAKVIFILASIALAGASVFDAYRLAEDPKAVALLDRRVIFFGSLALFILTVGAVVSTGMALRN